MAQTVIHGGINDSFSTQVQYTSQMASYALTNHSHSQYLTTAANSTHTHSLYLTTAALSNHSHTNYINISESGNVYFVNGNGVTFGSSVSGASTTITASININTFTTGSTVAPGNNYFINMNGHSWGSSVNGVSTYNWILTA